MSIRRPVDLRRSQYSPFVVISGLVTQDFDGAFYMERPGYLRTDLDIKRGARFRFHPNARYRQDLHLAIDYRAPIGTPVRAVHDGKVVSQGTDGTGGVFLYLQIKVGKVFKVIASYYHLKAGSFQFRVGDVVTRGQVVALSGNTGGLSTGGHLHFSLIRVLRGTPTSLFYGTGIRFDPQPFIDGESLTRITG